MEGSLRVLGDVRIESARGETRLHGRQQQLVLAQLVFAPDGVVSTARLTDVVWPDGHSSDHRGGALRGIISKIRRFVRSIDGWDVERVSGGYRLCPAAIRATDVFESAALLADIETVAAAEPGRAATLAARAADLLGSELLPGMDNSWADDQRRRITRQRVSAFRSAARFALESHDHDLAVRTAESAIRIDPLDEEHHYLLVRALLGAGRNSQAMRAADDCAELLQRELGTAASDRMKRLRVDAGRLAVPRPVDVRRLLPTSTKLPFVGRAVELGVLERAWNRATSIGLSVVWVHGAGGVGKTRLVREFLERIPEASVMVGLCSDEAVTPFEPIVNLVKSVSGDVGRDVSLVELLRSGDEQPLSDRSQLFVVAADWFHDRASVPTVVIVDDVHWITSSAASLLTHLCSALLDRPVLLVVTSREGQNAESVGRVQELVAGFHRSHWFESLRLQPLSIGDVEDLLDQLSVNVSSTDSLELHHRSGGNPLYLDRLLSGSRDHMTHAASVPQDLSLFIGDELDRLSSDAAEGLRAMAVLGVSAPLAHLYAFASSEVLGELVTAGLLSDDGLHARFCHAIVREVVLERMLTPETQSRHFVTFKRLAMVRPRPPSTTLAQHCRAAGPLAFSAGGLAAVRRAAIDALAAAAYEDAVEWTDLAEEIIAAIDGEAPSLARILLTKGQALRRLGNLDAATEVLRRGHALAFEVGDRLTAAHCILELVARGGRGTAVELTDLVRAEMLQVVIDMPWSSDEDDAALLVELWSELSLALLLTDQADRMVVAARRSTELASDSGDHQLIALALTARRTTMMGPVEAPRRLDASGAIDRRKVDREQATRLHMWRLRDSMEVGDRVTAERELVMLTESAARLGQPYWSWIAASWRAAVAFVVDSPERGLELLSDASAIIEDLGHAECAMAWQLLSVSFELRRGRGRAIVDLLAAVADQLHHLPVARAAFGLALAQGGRIDEARVVATELIGSQTDGVIRVDTNWSATMAVLVEIAARCGDVVLARTILPQLEPAAERFLVVNNFGAGGLCWGPADESIGLLHGILGDAASADALRRRGEAQCGGAGLEQVAQFGRATRRSITQATP